MIHSNMVTTALLYLFKTAVALSGLVLRWMVWRDVEWFGVTLDAFAVIPSIHPLVDCAHSD